MSKYQIFDEKGLAALTDHMKATRSLADSNESAIESLTGDLAGFVEEATAAIETKQDKLTFDATPTEGSANPVTSNGVVKYVDDVVGDIATILDEINGEVG